MGAQGYLYGEAPNAWVAGQMPTLPAGARVLALADGEGRNAVWLARQGYVVENWDYSAVGLDKTRQLAERAGVAGQVSGRCVDLTCCDWPEAAFDAVACSFLHLPSVWQVPVWQSVVSAMKPGAVLVAQVFSQAQLPMRSGGPKDVDLLYRLDVLQAALAGLDCQQLVETRVHLDEGPLHQGEACVINVRAVKP